MRGMAKTRLSAQALGYARADKRLEILQLVAGHGSISQAARAAGVSYKAAWQALHTLTNLAGEPLVDGSVGGAGGGGARLTAAGERLLRAARLVEGARQSALARLDGAGTLAAVVAPRTSMRNHLRANVDQLTVDAVREPMMCVRLAVDGGGALDSLITHESAELLGLAPGLPLLALCKATAVRVEALPRSTSALPDNSLPGRVASVTRGARNDEVTLTLHGGQQLVGFAARPNKLRIGARALAWVEPSAVVLALA